VAAGLILDVVRWSVWVEVMTVVVVGVVAAAAVVIPAKQDYCPPTVGGAAVGAVLKGIVAWKGAKAVDGARTVRTGDGPL
jgi:hypothetical protein